MKVLNKVLYQILCFILFETEFLAVMIKINYFCL